MYFAQWGFSISGRRRPKIFCLTWAQHTFSNPMTRPGRQWKKNVEHIRNLVIFGKSHGKTPLHEIARAVPKPSGEKSFRNVDEKPVQFPDLIMLSRLRLTQRHFLWLEKA